MKRLRSALYTYHQSFLWLYFRSQQSLEEHGSAMQWSPQSTRQEEDGGWRLWGSQIAERAVLLTASTCVCVPQPKMPCPIYWCPLVTGHRGCRRRSGEVGFGISNFICISLIRPRRSDHDFLSFRATRNCLTLEIFPASAALILDSRPYLRNTYSVIDIVYGKSIYTLNFNIDIC